MLDGIHLTEDGNKALEKILNDNIEKWDNSGWQINLGHDYTNKVLVALSMTKEVLEQALKDYKGTLLFISHDRYMLNRVPTKIVEMFSNKSRKEWEKRVAFCLERVGLSHAANLFPSEISGGMQKRAAIARAIVLEPTYLFCDEPNSGLDPKTSLTIDQLIQEITRENNITTVVNTHDMNSVMEIGDNILFIHKGEKGWEGSKDTIFDSNNENLDNLVFASELFKKVKENQIKQK